MKSKGFLLASVLLALLCSTPAWAEGTAASDIARELVCQCGCNMMLSSCTHAECGSRSDMTATIRQQVAQGKSREEVIQHFVARYGEQVLAAPAKRGFNLAAWILPFVGLAGGGTLAYFLVRGWVLRGQKPPLGPEAQSGEDEEYRCRVERELEDFGEGFT